MSRGSAPASQSIRFGRRNSSCRCFHTELQTLETDGQMLQRVMPDLMGMKRILVINDEAHHCYRGKPKEADDEDLKGEDKKRRRRTTRRRASGYPVWKRSTASSALLGSLIYRQRHSFLVGSTFTEACLLNLPLPEAGLQDRFCNFPNPKNY